MSLTKRAYYLLFLVAYIGALIIEKPAYMGTTVADCFSWLATVMAHFALFTCMILANNKILNPYILEKKRFGLYAGSLIGLVFLYTILIRHYNQFIHLEIFHDDIVKTSSGVWDNFVYALCCSVITSMLYITQKWAEQQEQVKNIQISQLQTELKYLRSQMNPHFLFNGLNTIYGTIDINNHQARDMTVQFSDLLRYNLYEADVDWVELEKEAVYLENYVALQRARSDSNLQIDLDIKIADKSVKVASLIFVAFVENAFKYSTRDDSQVNIISISLNQNGGQLVFTCRNSYEEQTPDVGGIGLSNAKRRLQLLYQNRYILDIKKDGGIYAVDLTINL